MADQPPLSSIVQAATSVADDLGFVALSDLASVLDTSPYRIIGGHMVTALAARWQLGPELYRATGDTDLGVPPVVVRNEGIIGRLIEHGYEKTDGNRFQRAIDDVPVVVEDVDTPRFAVVDVWRCLEVCAAAGTDSKEFTDGDAADGAQTVRDLFAKRDGAGMAALIGEQRLSGDAADQRFTRVRALIQRVVGVSPS